MIPNPTFGRFQKSSVIKADAEMEHKNNFHLFTEGKWDISKLIMG